MLPLHEHYTSIIKYKHIYIQQTTKKHFPLPILHPYLFTREQGSKKVDIFPLDLCSLLLAEEGASDLHTGKQIIFAHEQFTFVGKYTTRSIKFGLIKR